jgi:two-component system, OmpR family, sensor kinase ParS
VIRLFLKLYGVLIATLALSFFVQTQLMEAVWRHTSQGFDFRTRFEPTFHLIEEALAPLPTERWPARLAELASGFGLPARIERFEEHPDRPRLDAGQATTLQAGRIASIERDGGGFRLLKRLRGSDQVLAIDFPGPDVRRVRMLTYAVNWAIEFAIVAVLVFFWVRPFWRDLRRMHFAAEAIGAGRFGVSTRVGRFSPLRQFADAFGAMARRIAGLLQSHRMLTSAVSHELRTPIARLRFSHSLALEESDPRAKDRYLARMEGDIDEIDTLTSELLDYARLERGMPQIQQQVVPAEPWLEDVLADARRDGGRIGGQIEIRARVDLASVRCEPRYMARALVNLLRNASAHARSKVAVSLREEDGRTLLVVDDDGRGIPAAERERLFEPFTRLDDSRDRDSGGFGLGLAIVRQVARWHGGEATIADSPLGGARVSISW